MTILFYLTLRLFYGNPIFFPDSVKVLLFIPLILMSLEDLKIVFNLIEVYLNRKN